MKKTREALKNAVMPVVAPMVKVDREPRHRRREALNCGHLPRFDQMSDEELQAVNDRIDRIVDDLFDVARHQCADCRAAEERRLTVPDDVVVLASHTGERFGVAQAQPGSEITLVNRGRWLG